jgi:gliding motility-associated-like protein
MQKSYLLLIITMLSFSIDSKAQFPACDTNAINAALSSYTRFYVAGNPCAMYFVNNSNRTWAASQADAAAVGGYLATMSNQLENDGVVSGLIAAGYSTSDNFWIGLNAQGASSDPNPANWGWNWVDGSAYGFQNWVGGAPDNASGFPGNVPEDAVQIRLSDGRWNTLMSQNAGLFPAPTGRGIIKINLCPQLTATPGAAVCSGATTTINVSTTLGSPSYAYTVFLPPSLVPVASGSSSSIAISPPAVGNNNFLVLSEDRYGCPDTLSVNIIGNNCPTPTTTCDVAAIRTAFAASGNYTELVVPGQSCSMYFLDNRPLDAAVVEADANTLGAHLVVLNDATENTNVFNALTAGGYLANNARVWLGYRRAATASDFFVTLDGSTGNFLPPTSPGGPTPGIYQNWDAGEPNNNGYQCAPGCIIGCNVYECVNGEQCVQMRATGTWNDLPCDGSSRSVIEVNLCPQTTASNDTVVCSGGSVFVSANTILGSNPYTYSWTPGSLSGSTVSVAPATPTTYIVNTADRYGCSGQDSVFVNVDLNCNPPVGPVGCDIAAIRAAFGALGARYTELPVSGQTCSMYFIDNNSSDAATAEADANALGAHLTVFNDTQENLDVVAALNGGGYLAGNAPVWIGIKRVNTNNAQFYSLDGSTGNFNPGPATPTIYQNWAGGEPNNNRPGCCSIVCFDADDRYTCTNGEQCVQIYSNGLWNDLPCNRESKSVIEVNLCPELRGSGDTTLCASVPITLTTSTILGSQPYTYDWIPGGQTTANITVTPPTGTTPYIATATDRYGCKGKDTITVAIVPIPTPVLVANPSVSSLCTGENITISNTTAGISPSATFTWNFDGATIVSGSGVGPYVVNWTSPGQKTITLDVNEGTCVAPQATIVINVGNPPVVDAGQDQTICSGSSIQIGSPSITGYTYSWSNNSVLNNATISDPTFTYVNLGANPSVFSLTVIASDNGCTASDQITVTVNPPQAATIVANTNTTFCAGTTAELENINSNLSNFIWSTSQTSTIINVSTSGNYSLSGTDVNGCIFISNTITATQVPNPNAVIALGGLSNESCFEYEDGAINVTSNIGQAPFQYIWSNNQIGSSITGLAPGNYTVTVIDNANCSSTSNFDIQAAVPFGVVIDSTFDASCFGKQDGRIYSSVFGGTPSYRYLWSSGSTSRNLINTLAGAYALTVTDINNCTTSTSTTIIEPAQIVPTANYSPQVDYFTEMQIDLTVSPPSAYSYSWTPAQYFNCSDCEDPTLVAIRTTRYTVRVRDEITGCLDSLRIVINVDATKKIYIPNAFTPNGDSRNDDWRIFTKGIKFMNVEVFNRWGELVFKSFDLEQGWDGTFKGEPASPGIYPYLINVTYLDGEVIESKGSINLIK